MCKRVWIKLEYKCGHIIDKHELLHKGKDLQRQLDWFKLNVDCHACKQDRELNRRDYEELMGKHRDTYKRVGGAVRRK